MRSDESFIKDAREILECTEEAETGYLFCFDVMDFQAVNYFYGRDMADRLLDSLYEYVKNIPEVKLCRRFFSDRFLSLSVTKPGDNPQTLVRLYKEIMNGFIGRMQKEYPLCNLDISCGGCEVVSLDIEDAAGGANFARKEAKKSIRNRVVLYSDIKDKLDFHYKSQNVTTEALKAGNFVFYLQPKVDIISGEIAGAEALARRLDDSGNIVYPDAFLPDMENNGTIVELDIMICRQVCRYLHRRMEDNLPVVPTSINLSKLHMDNPETADNIHRIAQENHIPASLLEFEITETIFLDEFSGAKKLIDKLRKYGYRVSIDDFGSGYAGMNLWQELNFDCIKLDKTFLADSPSIKEKNEIILPNILNIAEEMDIDVICEGVETKEQCRDLLRQGCTKVQGFFFSKPVDPGEFYKVYEDTGGRYELSFKEKETTGGSGDGDTIAKQAQDSESTSSRGTIAIIIACVLVLCVGVAFTGILSRESTEDIFTEMVEENLLTYTEGQADNNIKNIENVDDTLGAVAALLRDRQISDEEQIDGIVEPLNDDETEFSYDYLSMSDVEKNIENGTIPDDERIDKLKQGETILSDVLLSEKLGEYVVVVGVPLMENGRLIGMLRGAVRAENLISTAEYSPLDGEIAASFITDSKGNVIKVTEKEIGWDGTLQAHLDDEGVSEATMEQLNDIYASKEHSGVIRLGKYGKNSGYLAVADMNINDWHLVICLIDDASSAHSAAIIKSNIASIVILLIIVAVVGAVLLVLAVRMQRRLTYEQQRYLLLGQFSDTVLFEYDHKRDVLRMTPNAHKLISLHRGETTLKNFLKEVNDLYIFPGDIRPVKEALSVGQNDGGRQHDKRIRLMRPDGKEFFWVQMQYQYVYENGTLRRIIGKLTDIDKQKKDEDTLKKKSEVDGLTQLVNKSAAEQKIERRLDEIKSGILFIIDVDSFKEINDDYGHIAGDKTLKFVADGIRGLFRTEDIMGRIGGDEMIIFASEITDRKLAQDKMDLLRRYLLKAHELNLPDLTLSIGASIYPKDGSSYTELFETADSAMYAAKKAGKNRLFFYEDVERKDK